MINIYTIIGMVAVVYLWSYMLDYVFNYIVDHLD